MNKRKILVSISGGRTSAMMAALIKKTLGSTCELIYVFANTSREEEETLIFLDKVDKYFNLGIVWVEAVTHYGTRKACTHRITNFQDAKRDGSVFEYMIKKYGIPNVEFKHCTRELKSNPIKSYAKACGFGRYGKDYETAIGYRADEQRRISADKIKKDKHFYILNDAGIKKADVNYWWANMPFDLELADFEGNCNKCHKKGKRKILTKIKQDREKGIVDNWHQEMENKYEQIKPIQKRHDKTPVRFFRHNDSISELIEESMLPFEEAIDKSRDTNGYNAAVQFDADMDYEDADCGSSCEPF
jgi:hypothetical protein